MKADRVIKSAFLVSACGFTYACAGQSGSADELEADVSSQHALSANEGEVWRPFSDTSPWNTPIDASARSDAQSASMIADWSTSSAFGPHLGVNMRSYSVPLFWADASTPKSQVECDVGGMGFEGKNGMNASAVVPMPPGAAPDPLSDGHLLVIDRDSQREWGLFHAAKDGAEWKCRLGAAMDLTGDGVRPIAEGNKTWYTSQGPRACGFPLVAGLIRPDEIRAGRIEHALVVAYPHIRAGLYTPPASTAQPRAAEATKERGIPCGGRVQLDPKLDVESLPMSDGARTIARALQEYGAYVGDYSGSMSLYADNSPEALTAWDELPISDVNRLDLNDFRVLELGSVYDNGNGD